MSESEWWASSFQHLAELLTWALRDIEAEELNWQPHPEANSIGVTLWHMGRAFDLFKVRLFEDRPVSQQLWFKNDYVSKSGYDPSGLGFEGFGNLAGYSIAEMQAIPQMPAELLLDYFHQTHTALQNFLKTCEPATLQKVAPGWTDSPTPIVDWLRNLLADGYAHIGEIRAMRAQFQRLNPSSGH